MNKMRGFCKYFAIAKPTVPTKDLMTMINRNEKSSYSSSIAFDSMFKTFRVYRLCPSRVASSNDISLTVFLKTPQRDETFSENFNAWVSQCLNIEKVL